MEGRGEARREERSTFLANTRAELALEIVPALVHRLNNSLAVLSGAAETLQRASVLPVQTEVERVRSALQGLATFCREQAPQVESFDLADVVQAVDGLVGPVAQALGVELQCRVSGTLRVVVGDRRRLAQLFVALAIAEVQRVGGPPGEGQPAAGAVVRFSLRARGGRVALTLTRRLDRAGTDPTETLLAAARLSPELGMEVLMRATDSALGYRFRFVALEADQEAPVAQPGAALLLVEDDPTLSELMSLVLGEAGYTVEIAPSFEASRARAPAFDLLLFDADDDIEPVSRDTEVRDIGTRKGVLLIGTAGSRVDGDPNVLFKPFRPQELLTAVAGILQPSRAALLDPVGSREQSGANR